MDSARAFDGGPGAGPRRRRGAPPARGVRGRGSAGAVLCALLLPLGGCAAASVSGRAAAPADAVVRPAADYHQHLMSPMLVALWGDPVLPEVELPKPLAHVLHLREQVSGTPRAGELYADDAQMVELSPWEAN